MRSSFRTRRRSPLPVDTSMHRNRGGISERISFSTRTFLSCKGRVSTTRCTASTTAGMPRGRRRNSSTRTGGSTQAPHKKRRFSNPIVLRWACPGVAGESSRCSSPDRLRHTAFKTFLPTRTRFNRTSRRTRTCHACACACQPNRLRGHTCADSLPAHGAGAPGPPPTGGRGWERLHSPPRHLSSA